MEETSKKVRHTLTNENLERQISEMWDAVHNIIDGNHRDFATQQAHETEAMLRHEYNKQEILRDAAPSLLEALENSVKEMRELLTEIKSHSPGSYRAEATINNAINAIKLAKGEIKTELI